MATSRRQRQVAELIQRQLGDLLERSVSDPRLRLVSVTDVQVTPDLRLAGIYISHLGDADETPQVMAALQHATPYLRRELAGRIGLRLMPELRFEHDDTLDRARRIDAILDNLHSETQETPPFP